MTKTRIWHLIIGLVTVGGGIATELLTTGIYSHAPWAATAMVVVSFIVSEVKAATSDTTVQK